MKASVIALVLSIGFLSLPVQAAVQVTKIPTNEAVTVRQKIDLNKADLNQLVGSFKGIGEKRAKAIIEYREKHDGIKSLDDLTKIKGFGKNFVNTNREKLEQVFAVN